MEASAKSAENVEDAFVKTAQNIYKKIQSGAIDLSSEVKRKRVSACIHTNDNMDHSPMVSRLLLLKVDPRCHLRMPLRVAVDVARAFVVTIHSSFPDRNKKHERHNCTLCSLPTSFVSLLTHSYIYLIYLSNPSLYYHVIYDWNPFLLLSIPFRLCSSAPYCYFWMNTYPWICIIVYAALVTCSIKMGLLYVTQSASLTIFFFG